MRSTSLEAAQRALDALTLSREVEDVLQRVGAAYRAETDSIAFLHNVTSNGVFFTTLCSWTGNVESLDFGIWCGGCGVTVSCQLSEKNELQRLIAAHSIGRRDSRGPPTKD